MEDNKPKRGGARAGAGRKPKAVEEGATELSVNAIRQTFGSEGEFFKFIADQARKGNYRYTTLLVQYAYGKAPETVTNINMNLDDKELTPSEMKRLNKILEQDY